MGTCPIMLYLTNRPCAIVGGGRAAQIKAETLLRCGADVTVIAPSIDYDFACRRIYEPYRAEHIRGMFLVVAATGGADLNAQIAIDARGAGALICRVDKPEDGDFIFPASKTQDGLTVAVSTNGAFPRLAVYLRDKLSLSHSVYLPVLEEYRLKARARFSPATRARFFTQCLEALEDMPSPPVLANRILKAYNAMKE